MKPHLLPALVVTSAVLSVVGCGGEEKAAVPTNLNQPLPPPPVGTGGAKPPAPPAKSEQ